MPRKRSKEDSRLLSEFGRRLRRIRKEKGFTQDELEHKAGINDNAVGRIERGERTVNYLQIMKISSALGINPALLFRDSQENS